MSRTTISLTLILAIMSAVALEARDADACGLKIAIKTVRQRARPRQPVNASNPTPVVARREAREPIRVGPTSTTPIRVGPTSTTRRTPVATIGPSAAKPAEPKAIVAKPTTPAEPTAEKAPVITQKPVDQKPVDQKPVNQKVVEQKPVEQKPVDQPEEKVATAPKAEKRPASPKGGLHDELYFGVGSSALGGNTASLDKDLKWLMANPDVEVVIKGYADPSGNAESNMALSQVRAEAVRDYLTAAGIDSARLEVMAFGDTKLKYGRSDARNRRVAIEVKK